MGGYGRRQLFPYSDVDLLLLFASDKTAAGLKDAISRFLQQLWDSGLRVSQSVHTPAECLELHDDNIESSVSLLDQRYLAGDAVVYSALLGKLPRFVQGQRDALVRHLSRMTRERHAASNSTFYHLEPNIKESPGGLRSRERRHNCSRHRLPLRIWRKPVIFSSRCAGICTTTPSAIPTY
ncbi:MAG: hypothetical protein DMG58_31200 [Acidobacteria bacterium]|nr:MAG: hypothetical protein DMG58_31200 [Acidobacteriota bacterium]